MKLIGGRRDGREFPREKGGEVIFAYRCLDGKTPPAWAVFAWNCGFLEPIAVYKSRTRAEQLTDSLTKAYTSGAETFEVPDED